MRPEHSGGRRPGDGIATLLLLAFMAACDAPAAEFTPVAFDRVQPELFETPGAQTNSWADYDGDGDLGGRFRNALPANLLEHGPSHGVAWADFDRDGDMDLSIANNHESGGTHHLYRNRLGADHSLQVAATDAEGRLMVPGAEVQLLDHESGAVLGTRLMDTGEATAPREPRRRTSAFRRRSNGSMYG